MPGRECTTGRRSAGSRRARSHGPRAALAGVVAAGVVLLVAGCTSTALPTESLSTAMSTEPLEVAADSAGVAAEVAPQMGGSAPATGGDAAQTAAAAQPPTISAVPPTGRQVILTATVAVTLTVPPVAVTNDTAKDAQGNIDARREAVAQASGAVRGAATAAGGYVSGADGGGSTMPSAMWPPIRSFATSTVPR